MQVDPIKPALKAPESKPLKLEHEKALSKYAFKFNLRRSTKVETLVDWRLNRPMVVLGRGLHSSTFQLNLSALHVIGGARRRCVAGIKGVFRVCRVFSCVTHGSN